MNSIYRTTGLAMVGLLSITVVCFLGQQSTSFASLSSSSSTDEGNQTYDPNGYRYTWYYSYSKDEREELSDKYKDVEWYSDCPNSPLDKETTPVEADKRVSELPAIINSTTEEDEKKDLQQELECLAFKRTVEREQTDKTIDEISKPLGEAYQMQNLFNQRQDIDRQLFDLMNN